MSSRSPDQPDIAIASIGSHPVRPPLTEPLDGGAGRPWRRSADSCRPSKGARNAEAVWTRRVLASSRTQYAKIGAVIDPSQDAFGAALLDYRGDSVTPTGPPQIDLRLRYRDLVTPWWSQYNIPASRMAALVEDTGWRIELHEEDGEDHAVLLRRT